MDRACTLGPLESADTEVVADAGARTVPSSLPEMVVMPAVDFASSVSHSELFGALCVWAFANHELWLRSWCMLCTTLFNGQKDMS